MAEREKTHDNDVSLKRLEKGLKDMTEEEQRRMRSLLQEKDKNETEEMTWMYKESKPDQEDYILGKRVDSYVDKSEARAAAVKDVPGALFSMDDNELVAKRADLDMQAKMREDPLFAIRKKEEDARKKLLQNPIKMKQLQKLLKEQEAAKKSKKKKKHKKHKKHAAKDSDSSDDDSDLVKKYLAILNQKHRKVNLSNCKLKSLSSDDKHKHKEDRHSSEHSEKHKDRHSEKHKDRHYDKHKSERRDKHKDRNRNESDDDDNDRGQKHRRDVHNSRRNRHDSDDDEPTRSYGLLEGKTRSPIRTSRRKSRTPERRRSRSPIHQTSRSASHYGNRSPPQGRNQSRKKLSAEEMDRKRMEMMSNAKERDDQRKSNVKRYKEEDEKEKQDQLVHGGDTKFIKNMMADHASQSTVEDRIKRNKFNVQRTKASLDKAFTRH